MTFTLRRWGSALAVSVCVVLTGCSLGPFGGSDDATTTITARFADAKGLYEGNAVAVLGMKVGEVTHIEAHPGFVEVVLKVDGSIKLPADVQAVTISDSLLTDRHVELTPVYNGGPTLPGGAVLATERTKTPVEFDDLLSMADKLSRSLAGDGSGHGPIADLMDVGAGITAGNGNGMRDALTELSRALQMGGDGGAATRDAITKVVTNLDSLTATAARNDQTLRQFGSGIVRLSDLLAQLRLGAGDTGAKLVAIVNNVADLMQKNQASIAALASNSNTMTKTLADYNNNLAEFLDVFPLVADNAYNAIDHEAGVLRAGVDVSKVLLDGQMVKLACNLLHLRELGCDTGSMRDMGPDFGVNTILEAIAGVPHDK